MSTLLQVEQTAATAQASTQQVIYPKLGAYARMDSTGVEKVFLDSGSYVAANSAYNIYITNYGV